MKAKDLKVTSKVGNIMALMVVGIIRSKAVTIEAKGRPIKLQEAEKLLRDLGVNVNLTQILADFKRGKLGENASKDFRNYLNNIFYDVTED